jgi:hypothetical protein
MSKTALLPFTPWNFLPNLGHFSEEHGDRTHQDIEAMEKRYQGRWTAAVMADYVWGLLAIISN